MREWEDKEESEKAWPEGEVRINPAEHLVTKFRERGWQVWNRTGGTKGAERGKPAAIGIEVRREVVNGIIVHEGFSRDSTNKVDPLCLVHLEVESSPRSGGRGWHPLAPNIWHLTL